MLADGYKDTEIGVIPIEWEVSKLNDILTIGSGKDYKHLEKGDIPVYGTGGFMLSVNKCLYDGESVCIGRKGTIDKPMFLTGKFWTVDTLFYTHLFKGVKPKFLYYSFLQIDWKKYNEASGVPSLSKKTIEVIKIPLPPLKEQEKIADILSTADDKIDAIASQIQKAETLKKGLLQKLLSEGIGHSEFKDSELGKIPESWKVVKLNDISRVVDSLHITPSFVDDGISMVRVSDIKLGKLNLKDTFKVTEETFITFTKNYTPRKDDIVLSRVGSYGVSSYVSTDEPFCMGQNTVVINPLINSKYIYYNLNSRKTFKQIEIASYGSGYKSLSLKNIKELKIPLPPFEEQKQIANILSTADEKLEVLRAKKEKYEVLKQGLMQKLLTGEVRVSV